MYRLWGVLLGLVLTAALPILAGEIETHNWAVHQDAMLVAVALVLFCLLGVLIFKPTGSSRQMRVVRGRAREDEE